MADHQQFTPADSALHTAYWLPKYVPEIMNENKGVNCIILKTPEPRYANTCTLFVNLVRCCWIGHNCNRLKRLPIAGRSHVSGHKFAA
jgi:hypothetical protein